MSLLHLIAAPTVSSQSIAYGAGSAVGIATVTGVGYQPGATSWIGVPDPDWGTTIGNPITYAKPSWPAGWYTDTEEPGYFYIDPSHQNAGSYTYGTPDHPRATDLSGTTWAAGTYIEYGGGTILGAQKIWTCNGTSTSPVWIVGSGGIHNYEFILKGSYIFIDGLQVTAQAKGFELRTHSTSSLHHVCVRNCTMTGTQTFASGGCVSMQGNSTNLFHDFVIYNNAISYFGDWEASSENDYHGVKPRSYVDDVWIVNNHIHHMGGDSVQVGEASLPSAEWVNNIYIAGNNLHDNYEEAIDIKCSNYVVCSQNHCHGKNGAGMFTHDNPDHVYFIFNEIDGVDTGIGMNEASNVWAIGNIIHDVATPAVFTGTNTSGKGAGIAMGAIGGSGGAINNIIYGCYYGIQVQADSNWIVNNNIITNMADSNGPQIICDTATVGQNTTFDYNLVDNSGKIRWDGVNMITLAQLQSTYSKGLTSFVGDPDYTNPPTDFTPSGTSDVIDAGNKDSSGYTAYYNAIGVNIEVDYDENTRPATAGDWDVGPYEVA